MSGLILAGLAIIILLLLILVAGAVASGMLFVGLVIAVCVMLSQKHELRIENAQLRREIDAIATMVRPTSEGKPE